MNRQETKEALQIFLSLANKYLHDSNEELSYLLTRIPEQYIDYFMFGYLPPSPNGLMSFMDEFGVITKKDPATVFEELKIIYSYYSKKKSFFNNNTLLIPFFDIYGNPASIVGRTLLEESVQKELKVSKYKNLPFKKRYHLFGLNYSYNEILEKDAAIIVEGQFDFYSTYISGIKNCVALCGSKMTFEQVLLLKRFTNNFYILLDNDEAGIDGIEKLKKQSKKYGINVTPLSLPAGKDIDDFAKLSNWNISLKDLLI